jgi:PAS domain S-box-containing protein
MRLICDRELAMNKTNNETEILLAQLRESETRFRTLAETLPGFVWIDGEGGKNEYMNRHWEDFTGQSVEEARAEGWQQGTHPDDLPRVERRWASSRRTGEPYEMELRHRHKEGSYHWFLAKGLPLRDAAGKIVRWVGTSVDIQKQKESLEALQASEARLSLTLQAGNLGSWDSDLMTGHTYWSPEQERLFGLLPGEFDGRFSNYVHPEDRTRVLRKIAEVKVSGKDYADEFRVVWPDGRVCWLAGRGRILRDEAGQAVRLMGVNFDVTERKRKELNAGFLLELSTKVRTLSKADEIERTVIESLGTYLQVTNCNVSTVDVTNDWLEVHQNYQQGGGVRLGGGYKLSDYIAPEFIRFYKQGEAVVVYDVSENLYTKTFLTTIHAPDMKSLLVVPYVKEGQWVAALNVSCNTPRQWRKDEQELAETVTAQFLPVIERARSDAIVARLAERFRLTETSAKSFLYEWDLTTDQVWRSPGMEAVTGFRPEDIPKDASWWNARVHPDDEERANADTARALAYGGDYSAEYRVRHRDGHYLYLWDRGRVTLDMKGKAVNLLGTSTNVSHQKTLELQLAETAARLEATITFLPLGFCLLSKDYRYIRINEALASLNGLSVEAHIGQKVVDILPHVWNRLGPILKAIEVTREPVLNVAIKHPTQERTWLVSYYPVPDVDGSLLGFGSVALEITEREQALNALRESNVKLRDLSAQQQRFVADAAHELRAPLTSVRGNLDLLTRYEGIPVDEQREMFKDLSQETLRLSRLVADLLELARGDSGLTMNLQRMNLAAALLEVWHQIQRFNKTHTFELEEMPDTNLSGDPDRLKQLALILLDNAVKYTPEGGTVSLSIVKDSDHANVYIRDTGIGIASDDVAYVFERFYRADKARTRAADPGGTGLGLSIADWIVSAHKGEILLESELGKGTTVLVRLPLAS